MDENQNVGSKTPKKAPSTTALTVVIIVLAVLLVTTVSLLAVFLLKGSTGGGKEEDQTSQASKEPELDEETKALYATETVNVDGESINYEIYRYYYLNCKASFDGGKNDYWETEEGKGKLDELKEEVLKELRYEIAALHMAKEQGITFTEEDQKELESTISYMDAQYKMYGSSLQEVLSSYYMTMDSFIWMSKYEAIMDKLYEQLSDPEKGYLDFSDEKVEQSAQAYYHVKHILYATQSGKEEEALEKATKTLEKLQAIENAEELLDEFEKLIVSDSDDYNQNNPQTYYYFKDGVMVEEFENATKALSEGQLSELVKTDYGYHIILRLPIDLEQFKKEVYTGDCAQKLIQERADGLAVTETEFYKNLMPTTAK